MRPKVSIIIVNWNKKEDTIHCLSSLKNISYQNFKIVVVDNGSTDGSQKAIKANFPEVELIENEKNLGVCKGNNIAIKKELKEKTDYILLLNNDTVIKEPNFLDILVNYADKKKEIGIVGPKTFYYKTNIIQFGGGKINNFLGFAIHMYKGVNEKNFNIKTPYEVDYISSCCLLIKKEVIRKVGLLDPIFFAYYDDTDWCFRAKKAGYKIILVPESTIFHQNYSIYKTNNKLNSIKSYYLARNAIIFGRKNLSGLKKMSYLLAQFIFRAPFNLAFLMQDFNSFKKYLKGVLEAIVLKLGNNNYRNF